MLTLRTILVPTDFSDASGSALDYAAGLAEAFDAGLHVVHVMEDLLAQAWSAEVYVASTPRLREEIEREAGERIRTLAQPIVSAGRPVTTVVLSGNPFLEIVRYAKAEAVDLIVIGTHGRGPIAHMLLGSVAERVVRKAPCPVLTVRSAQHDFIMP